VAAIRSLNVLGPHNAFVRTRTALIAVAFTVVAWGAATVAIKATTTTGLVASFYRLWFAIAALWVIMLFVPRLRRGLNRTWWRASLAGGVSFGLHQIFFFISLKLTTVANVVIIAALQPMLVAFLAGPFFGERVAARDFVWALLAVGGTAAVVFGSVGSAAWSPLGDTLAVLNLFGFTAYILVSKHFRARVGVPEYMAGMTTVAGIMVGMVTLFAGSDLASPTRLDLIILLFVGLVTGTMGHFVINWAHAHVSVFSISVLILGVPVVASACAALFIDEPFNCVQAIGGAVVLIAIGMVTRSTRRKTK
jgi:drug/metabolite transporter (DMT)-like permease